MRDKNQILDFAAEHDTLTKLYNHTGVMGKMLNMIHADEDGKFAVIMADRDHLKQIILIRKFRIFLERFIRYRKILKQFP